MEVEDNTAASTFLQAIGQNMDRFWNSVSSDTEWLKNHKKHGSATKFSEAQQWQGRREPRPLVSHTHTTDEARDPFLQRKKHRAEGTLSGGCRLPVEMFDLLPIPEWGYRGSTRLEV